MHFIASDNIFCFVPKICCTSWKEGGGGGGKRRLFSGGGGPLAGGVRSPFWGQPLA